MADFVDQLLRRADIELGDPASPSSLDALVERCGATLPAALLRIWRAGEGIALESLDAHILGPTETLHLIDNTPWSDLFAEGGFLPLLDDHQSNYLAVIVRDPLSYRVASIPHDDGSRLLYRELNAFAKALLAALDDAESADLFFRDTPGDYLPDAPRAQEDQDAARLLMVTDGMRDEWNYAAQLLDASKLAEWAKLLETDHFVRRHVLDRMSRMRSPAIQELLKRDRLAFEEFACAAADAARRAGLDVGEQQQDCLQVCGTWMNLESFFHRRNIRDAMPRMITWFEDLIASRDPYKRSGHFMAD